MAIRKLIFKCEELVHVFIDWLMKQIVKRLMVLFLQAIDFINVASAYVQSRASCKAIKNTFLYITSFNRFA